MSWLRRQWRKPGVRMAWLLGVVLGSWLVVLLAGSASHLPDGYGRKQFESASKLVHRSGEWKDLRAGTGRDNRIYIPIYIGWSLFVAGMVAVARWRYRGSDRRWWVRLMDSRLVLAGAVVVAGAADLLETHLFHRSLTRLIATDGKGSIGDLVGVTQVFSFLKFLGLGVAVLLIVRHVLTSPVSMMPGIGQEIARGRLELDRLRTLDRPRVPILAALVGSAVVVVLGNGVVAAGRRWCQPEWITLVGVPAMGLLGVGCMALRGWRPSDLGLQGVQWEPRTASRWLVWLAAFLAPCSAMFALVFRDRVTMLDVATLFIGTAIGEEIVHRGFVLGAWAATRLRGAWVVTANVVTFGLWHVVGANHDKRFHWLEVVGPAALAVPLMWARLRFRSVLASAAFHGAANMTGTAATSAPAPCVPHCPCKP